MIPARFGPVLEELAPLANRFAAAGHRLYVVGGTVRDLLIGDGSFGTTDDIDLTTSARPEDIHECVRDLADAVWNQGERFGTVGARIGERILEITTFRAESYTDDSRKPHVVFADDVETDLARRDFTINAMALELTSDSPTLVDPHSGAVDLVQRVLRTPLSAEESFSDDPLRMLRAARFITSLDLVPVPELVAAVQQMAGRLEIVSAERIRDEFEKLICTRHPTNGLWFLVETGLADQFLPELPAMRLEHDPIHRHKDVLTHTFAVVDNVRPHDELDEDHRNFDFRTVRLAALFHDVGKPRTRGFQKGKGTTFHHHDVVGAKMTRRRLTELRFSSDDVSSITELVALHLRFHTYRLGWSDSAVRRYVRDAGDLLSELNVLTRCDCTTRNEKKARTLSRRMDELEERIAELAAAEELAALRPELDGSQVMEHLGLRPGPEIGRALAFLMEIRLEEGLIGEEAARARLDEWFRGEQES